ncbi:MAG: hypothetical protein SGPRY_005091, partial [Prymnesium sp.]
DSMASDLIGEQLLFPLINSTAQIDRFRPRGLKAALTAVYQVWNLLDRYNLASLHSSSVPWVFGYTREVQLEALIRAVQQPGVKTYCEVGFNGGHSSVAVLVAAPDVKVRAFDNAAYGRHTKHNEAQIRLWFPERFILFDGDSKFTLPQFVQRVREGSEPKCDVLLVDGSHEEHAARRDLHHMSEVASCGAPVFMDDLGMGPGKAVLSMVQGGTFRMNKWLIYDSRPHPPVSARAEAMKRNATYIQDPLRKLNPCLRYYAHKKAIGKECSEEWDEKKCRLCLPVFEWGIGEFPRSGSAAEAASDGSDSVEAEVTARNLTNTVEDEDESEAGMLPPVHAAGKQERRPTCSKQCSRWPTNWTHHDRAVGYAGGATAQIFDKPPDLESREKARRQKDAVQTLRCHVLGKCGSSN